MYSTVTSHPILYCMKRILHKCSLTLKHIGHTPLIMYFLNLWKHCYIDSLMLLFIKYKCTWLTAISMSLSRCITFQDVCVQQSQQNACHRYTKWTFADLLPCYCYAIKTNSRTIRSPRSQPASAGKGGDMSELQAHHCMTLQLWNRLLCRVSFIPAKTVIARIKSINRN